MPDETLERRKLWRHLMQCVLAEQAAREHHAECGSDASERRLLAEGVRVDAAIDALDETLADDHRRTA